MIDGIIKSQLRNILQDGFAWSDIPDQKFQYLNFSLCFLFIQK